MRKLAIAFLILGQFACAAAQGKIDEEDRIFEVLQLISPQDIPKVNNMDSLSIFVRMPAQWSPAKDKEYRRKRIKSVRGVIAFSCVGSNLETVRNDIVEGTSPYHDVIAFADKNNLAIISWPNFRGYDARKTSDDFTKEEWKKYSDSFELRAKYWERAYRKTINAYNLPENNMIVYGMSGGAQIAHRLVMRYPQYFIGIYAHVSSTYDAPSRQASKVLWFISTGEADGGYSNSVQFYGRLLDSGYIAIFKAFENLGHARRDDVNEMSLAFYDYLLAFMPDANDPNWKAPPVDKFEMMKYPAYIGDYLNHLVYPAEKAVSYIDRKRMVAIPTRALAQKWGSIVEK